MNYFVRQAIKWRKSNQERSNRVEKIINVIRSCKTDEQLMTAINLVNQVSINNIERSQFNEIILEVASQQVKDVTMSHHIKHENFVYNSLLWLITGERSENDIVINRAVFIPWYMEVDLSKVYLKNKLI